MKYTFILLFFISINLSAQINLLNISPTDGSTNVSLNTTITVEFDQPIDTASGFKFFQDFFTNAFDLQSKWFSSDLKTVNIGANLDSNKNYYFMVYSAFGTEGQTLVNPTVVYFTTGSELTGNTVTGTVSAGENSGLDLSRTLVALSSTSVENDEPKIEAGAFANSFGVYTIPYVNNGEYYPLAANDANEDGMLDPSGGDAFDFKDKIMIDGDYSNLNFSLFIPDPISLRDAFDRADSLRQELFSGNVILKRINTWDTDSLGNAGDWEFYFISDTLNKVIRLRIDQFGYNLQNRIDEWEYQNLVNMEILESIDGSVPLNVFMENAEAAGGYDFRTQSKPSNLEFGIELILADHRYSYISDVNPDTSQHIMWAAVYRWVEQIGEDEWRTESEEVYFGNFETGELIVTGITETNIVLPSNYVLEQNYPNPFNPATTISYSIPSKESVSISVYDIIGNKIETLVNEIKDAGKYNLILDASLYSTGTYFYQIKTEKYTNTKKMLLIK